MAIDPQVLIRKYRREVLPGRTINLVPYAAGHAPEVVRLRSAERVRHFLNQAAPPTLEAQRQWEQGYLSRANDLYWMVERDGTVIGTNRLYDIRSGQGEKGSQIIDEEWVRRGPFALESELLLLRLAFETLELARVIAAIRPDSDKVLYFNRRLGFRDIGSRDVRSVEFLVLSLERERFDPKPFDAIINHWSRKVVSP